jgi:hypothetical protein
LKYEENHKIIEGIEHKKCSVCDEWFPMTNEYFYKNKSSKVDGFHTPIVKNVQLKSNKIDIGMILF